MSESTRAKSARFLRRWRRRLGWTIAALLAWFVVHLIVLAWVGVSDDHRPSDVGVVLGNFVDLDGNPGAVVRGRLDEAVKLYRAGAFAHVIVSGAKAPGGYDEAAGMRRYLIEQGVPTDAVIADHGGTNTFLTALNTRRIMRDRGWTSALVISQYYHVMRTRLAFWRMDIADVRSSHATEGREMREPYILFREFVAFYWYLVRSYPAESP